MNIPQWTQLAQKFTEAAGLEDHVLTTENFLDYADRLKDVLLALPKKRKADPVVRDFALQLRRLRDDFEDEVTSDPMCVYKPKHAVALAAHKSLAKTRYYFGAFRTSKTTFGIAEIYWTLTDQHPWRPHPPQPAQCAIVGTDYAHYGPMVFEAKYFDGEQGNPLSPVFPEGGKWLYRYDDRKKIAEIACDDCAATGRGQSCSHLKRKLILFSDEGDPQAMEGGQYALIQFDEQIDYEYYKTARNRIKTVRNSGIVITETPKKGRGFWTQKQLVPLAKSGATIPGTDIPLCETFQIDQFQAGLVPHNEILAGMEGMAESEIRVEIFGDPLVDLEHAIFDADVLSIMRKEDVFAPKRGSLSVIIDVEGEKVSARDYTENTQRQLLERASMETECMFHHEAGGSLRVWRMPQKYTQYIIGADVSHGLTGRDLSCADVLAMTPFPNGVVQLEQEAQWHDHINPMQYAEELFKLGLFYSQRGEGSEQGDYSPPYFPWLVVERNGPGLEVIQCLIDMGCWFLFQDVTSGAQIKYQLQNKYGVGTTLASKPVLVAVLQAVVRAHKRGQKALILHSDDSIDQMETYVQEQTDKGNVRFGAESGSHDDSVMSLAVGTYATRNFPIFDWELHARWKELKRMVESKTEVDARSARFWKEVHEEDEKRRQIREEEEAVSQLEEEYFDGYDYDDNLDLGY